jgi:bifunctional non-homologous end joining protein LigD
VRTGKGTRDSTCAPTLRSAAPRGEQWIHEIKFDGWRIQLHKHGSSAALFTKNGHDHSSRVRWMTDALARLPGVRSFIIDGELVACNDDGLPDFYALHFSSRSCVCMGLRSPAPKWARPSR